MRNKNTSKLHRLNVNLTDGEYYTLQNLANFYHLTVSDYVKKFCHILGTMPQREFVPVWNREEKKIELIDDTPEPVQWGDMTLREYYVMKKTALLSKNHSGNWNNLLHMEKLTLIICNCVKRQKSNVRNDIKNADFSCK